MRCSPELAQRCSTWRPGLSGSTQTLDVAPALVIASRMFRVFSLSFALFLAACGNGPLKPISGWPAAIGNVQTVTYCGAQKMQVHGQRSTGAQAAILYIHGGGWETGDRPPFLIVHGKKDKFVGVAQSVKLAVALQKAGHEPLLVVVENAGHGLVPRGGQPKPDNATIDKLLVAFFTEYLR